MIKQGIANNSILEKKFKILRTSIMLGNITDRENAISEYAQTAREVDSIRRGVYEELLASKMYTTVSLEEEEVRLKELIKLIEDRVKERNEFIDDYIKITSNFLDDLPKVSLESELPSYKLRLDNILEYLSNCDEIKKLNTKLAELRDELEEKYENRANNEIINTKLEDELVDEFNKLIVNNEYYASLNYTDIDSEIAKVEGSIHDKEDVMNTFVSSYDALKNAGISGAEREEYLSYVQDAKSDYYNEINKKCMLSIYKLVLDKENNYDELYQKRENIDNILKERERYRRDLNIVSRDDLGIFRDLCNEQFSVIKSQKLINESIDKLIMDIADCESKLDELDKANTRSEIVSLLDEFALKSPEAIKIDMPKENEIYSKELFNDDIIIKGDRKVTSNMVLTIKEPVKIDVNKAANTAKLVMKKVVIVLEPKRFNNKRDKLKEAELELKKEAVNDKEQEKDNKINITLDISNGNDIFIDDVNTKGNDIFIPTEVDVIEPDSEKPKDLFSETDPFLDDNQFEKDDALNSDNDNEKGMPRIDNIGSVRPNNSMLNKIENAARENEDIILPTMGLTDNEKVDVPIVSENYIKE